MKKLPRLIGLPKRDTSLHNYQVTSNEGVVLGTVQASTYQEAKDIVLSQYPNNQQYLIELIPKC